MQSLKDLCQKSNLSLQQIITHEGIIPLIRNQDSILKTIFTYQNLQRLIEYMIKQHPLQIKKERSLQQYKQLSKQLQQKAVKIHYAAMDILSNQCHHITNLLFSQPRPLIQKLLSFLDMNQHYMLASYFSKVMVAITKRVSNPSNKFNNVFCKFLFDDQYNFIYKAMNHLYSQTAIDYIVRWLSLSSYQIKKSSQMQINKQAQLQKQPNDMIYDHRIKKKQLLINILTAINQHKLDQSSVQTSVQLFTNLVNQPANQQKTQNPNNRLASIMNKKAKSSATAFELFSLVCDPQVIQKIFQVANLQEIGTGKLKLIKIFVKKYKQSQQSKSQQYFHKILYQVIQSQMLEGVLAWIQFWIKNYFNEKSHIYKNNSILLSLLQLLEELQSINCLKENIFQYYTQNPQESIQIIINTIKTKNNLIQLAQSRIIMNLLINLQCYDFGKRLLLQGIIKIIDEQSMREHVVKWAQNILQHYQHVKKQQQHIFQNQNEESQWQHIRQLVNIASEIKVGSYRFKPSNIYFCYSQQKAKLVFGSFLLKKPVIIYNQKKQKVDQINQLPQISSIKKTQSTPSQIDNKQQPFQEIKKNNSFEQINTIQNQIVQQVKNQDPFQIQFLRPGYLNFSLDQLLYDL